MSSPLDEMTEWLEADGLGGFASGTAIGIRTRRYHGLLLASATPPTRRFMLVNGLDARLERDGESFGLSSQLYESGEIHPRGALKVRSFTTEPWPRWIMRLPNGDEVIHELFVPRGSPMVVLSWRLIPRSLTPARLTIRPFFSGRDYHELHHENPSFGFEPSREGQSLRWRAYQGVPEVIVNSNGIYSHAPAWYRSFLYRQEQARGFDATEDLAAPGSFEFDLSKREAILIFAADAPGVSTGVMTHNAATILRELRDSERIRRNAATSVDLAADAYIVKRGDGDSIIAGYPWFADWGRDTFISIRGLCIARGRLAEAQSILLQWANAVSEGMLPNRFADAGDAPEYNSVDASLWFVVAVHELLAAADKAKFTISALDRETLLDSARAIVSGYASGTRHGIRMDTDGLLACGEPGVQLTWMDARVGDRVITPRIGKPVEVQALWINALWIVGHREQHWRAAYDQARASFGARFWNPGHRCLYDVVDVDHIDGSVDSTLRPNQVFAVGGLPLRLLDDEQSRAVVDLVETELLTPAGLRSLARNEPGYTSHYRGGPAQRDEAYHQGTVWPWLIGPFVEAWIRVREADPRATLEARSRFLEPLRSAFMQSGHLPEIADAEEPHASRGCPFQAWSVGELIRLDRVVLADPSPTQSPGRRKRALAAAVSARS